MTVTAPYAELALTPRMRARVQKPDGDNGCWLYPSVGRGGYGVVNAQGRSVAAHRLFYTHLVVDVPAHLTLDHLCRVKACVNPAHLEPVTHLENVRRGLAGHHERIKTHCRNGHPYAGENVRRGSYGRVCRTCNNEACARYRARRKAVAA